MAVLRDYAVCYGDKVSGWWVDGRYTNDSHNYTQPKLKMYHDAIRAGNPKTLIAQPSNQ